MADSDPPAPDDGLGRHVRKAVLLTSLLVTAVGLLLYALGIPGGDIYLFVAGLSGGAAVAEAAEALERRDAAREQEEVLRRNRELRDRVSALKQQIHTTREPALRAAAAVGSAFAMRNTNPDSEDAAFLGVSDELRSAHDVNDTFGICRTIKTRWGAHASESFMLGRQLTSLLGAPAFLAQDETRSLIHERLTLRTDDAELVAAVDRAVQDQTEPGPLARYTGLILRYVTLHSTSAEAKQLRARLLRGYESLDEEPPSGDDSGPDPTSDFRRQLAILVAAGVHERDPDVRLFLGVLTHDTAMVSEAMANGADPNVPDLEILRRHRNVLDAAG
ncbi:hypothetical protein [Streptomyces sp. NPDC002088]|uniref:hypothetical protein n=1 Tax=Streptomyces sp. NPDC002088 TaxID=3154665 RepID=UPI00331B365B